MKKIVVEKRYAALISAGLCLFLIPFAWPHLFFKGQVPIDGNVLRLLFPNQIFLQAHPPTLQSWPLWNPFRNMGEPFLADPVSMAAYPPVWLLCHLRDILAFFRWWVVGHSLLAGCFMGQWVYHRSHDRTAAWAAACIMMFNGFFMARVTLAHHFASAAYLPVVLYYFDREKTFSFGIAMALQWLAGFPSFSYITVLVLLVWAVLEKPTKGALLWRGGLVALGLAAYQVFPFLELILHSARGIFLVSASATEFSESFRQLVKILCIPQWFAWHPQLTGDQAVVSFYVGPIVLLMVGWAAWKGQRRDRVILSMILGCVLLSLGGHLPGYSRLPFLRVFRYPANWLLAAVTGMAFLSGMGLSRIASLRWKGMIIGVMLVDLLGFAQYLRVPWFAPTYLTVPPPLVEALRASVPSRIYHSPLITDHLDGQNLKDMRDYTFIKQSLAPSYGMAFGVRELSSYQVLTLSRAQRYQNRLSMEGPTSPLLRLAGVSTVLSRRPGSFLLTEQSLAIVKMKTFEAPLFIVEKNVAHKIVPDRYEPGQVRAMVFVDKPATLVFSEVEYPGWEAWIDDQPVPHGVFEETFLSVAVPPGAHWVQWRYRSSAFAMGWVVTSMTILTGVLFLLRKGV